ncbi:prepilin-type N-terminal cleavage/methylation domain-containing protein [Pseudomonas sp. F1_0610]|uniref:PilW family protein n=1 Tax=Pseudomonas sp. F1_0610 TaxID=3114284 RepID=UPI0039C0467F
MRKYSQGISLIEIMITLLLSSFLILGITQIYLNYKRSYAFERSVMRVNDTANFAQTTLNRWIYKAGFRRTVDASMEKSFPQATYEGKKGSSFNYTCDFDEQAVATNLQGGNGFCIRYQALSSEELDCLGEKVKFAESSDLPFAAPSANDLVVLAFEYTQDANKNQGSIWCSNLNPKTTVGRIEILDHIADATLEFGWAQSVAHQYDKKVDIYTPVSEWKGKPNNLVRSIRYSLLVSSKENVADTKSEGILNLWKEQKSTTKALEKDKKQIYEIVNATYVLRGIMP